MTVETSPASTRAPPIETIRSPGRSPIDSAGEFCETSSTVVVAFPPVVM